MRKEILQKMEIPKNVEVLIEKDYIVIKGSQGENKRKINLRNIKIYKENKELIFECKKATKKEKKAINTFKAHVKNMIDGVSNKFEYQLKICYSHFPITAEVKGNELIIKNFIGEKENRKAKIPKGAEVKVDKEIITINSINREIAGQAAANIEQSTKIRKKDRRVFQDGIFIINKAGKEI